MATVLQTPPVLLSFGEQQDLIERNDFSYRSTVDYKELPQPAEHVAHQALPDRVLVAATDMTVLAAWLYVMGGTVSTVDLPHGQTVWTLTTQTWTDSPRFPVVPVYVSVTQATDADVMHEIRAAVAR
ncbi:hypothetical protein OG342_05215 [Streptomyces bobili]|uniref:hypothetical protein n=1 Tax=Streptomyces bobili TaxID=67280 RepID=UPI002258A384|nr:hypothetical protein [Streptomyces bobili]MCX5522268.1 hypothetical protein [Streptomyces bobili]